MFSVLVVYASTVLRMMSVECVGLFTSRLYSTKKEQGTQGHLLPSQGICIHRWFLQALGSRSC